MLLATLNNESGDNDGKSPFFVSFLTHIINKIQFHEKDGLYTWNLERCLFFVISEFPETHKIGRQFKFILIYTTSRRHRPKKTPTYGPKPFDDVCGLCAV
jgi:hypothetical protein